MGLQFDRAVFRVYERSLWGFTSDDAPGGGRCTPNKVCWGLQASLLFTGSLMLLATIVLDSGHVGRQGCLGIILNEASQFWGNQTAEQFFEFDDIIRISIDYDGVTGGKGAIVFDGGLQNGGDVDVSGGGAAAGSSRVSALAADDPLAAPWPPGGNPLTAFSPDYVFSFTPALVALDAYPAVPLPSPSPSPNATVAGGAARTAADRNDGATAVGNGVTGSRRGRQLLSSASGSYVSSSGGGSRTARRAESLHQSSPSFVSIGSSMSSAHGFRRFNVSLPVKCAALASSPPSKVVTPNNMGWSDYVDASGVGTGFDFLLGSVVSIDTLIVNNLMWSFPHSGRGGYVRNTKTLEDWGWPQPTSMITTIIGSQPPWSYGDDGSGGTTDGDSKATYSFMAFAWRLSALFSIVISYFFITTVSALLIRALLTSGVAFIYPFAALIRTCMPHLDPVRDSDRQINASYPWLGAHMRQLRLVGESASPFLYAHIQSVVVTFALYQCAQSTLAPAFWQWKSIPLEMGFFMWATFLLLEYFSLVYVRTRLSMTAFGRGVALGYALWGWYFYSRPYGFFTEATTCFVLYCLWLCVWCAHKYEVPALRHGKVSFEKPREALVRLAALEPIGLHGGMPEQWTIFHSINFVPRDLYDQPVPAAPAGPGEGPAPGQPPAAVTVVVDGEDGSHGAGGANHDGYAAAPDGSAARGSGHGASLRASAQPASVRPGNGHRDGVEFASNAAAGSASTLGHGGAPIGVDAAGTADSESTRTDQPLLRDSDSGAYGY